MAPMSFGILGCELSRLDTSDSKKCNRVSSRLNQEGWCEVQVDTLPLLRLQAANILNLVTSSIGTGNLDEDWIARKVRESRQHN